MPFFARVSKNLIQMIYVAMLDDLLKTQITGGSSDKQKDEAGGTKWSNLRENERRAAIREGEAG